MNVDMNVKILLHVSTSIYICKAPQSKNVHNIFFIGVVFATLGENVEEKKHM